MSRPNPAPLSRALAARLIVGSLTTGVIVGACGLIWAPSAESAIEDRSGSSESSSRRDTKRPTIAVRHNPRVAYAPGAVQTRVDVARHPENRRLRVSIESASYYGSSEVQLDGHAAPRSHFLVWKRLPAGGYRLEVTVFGTSGIRDRLVIDTGFRVIDR